MAIPATSTLMRKYLANKKKVKELRDKAKPLEDENKQLEAEVLRRLQDEGKDVYQHGKMLATVETKPASVSWASEFLKACGPDAAEEARSNAGTKTCVNITTVGE